MNKIVRPPRSGVTAIVTPGGSTLTCGCFPLDPRYAESKWLGTVLERQEVRRRQLAGTLSPLDSYNVIIREPTGEIRYVTNFADGDGKT